MQWHVFMSDYHVLLFWLRLSGSVDLKPGFTLETLGIFKQVLMLESHPGLIESASGGAGEAQRV